MNKSTLFTVFLSGLMLVIMTELLVDKYWANSGHLKADVFNVEGVTQENDFDDNTPEENPGAVDTNMNIEITQQQNPLPAPVQTLVSKPNYTISLQTFPDQPSESPATQEQISSKITFSLVQNAGFQQVSLQRIPFNGMLFEHLALKNIISLPVTVQHLLKNNSLRIATFYEFETKSHLLAEQVYRSLQEKFSYQSEVRINATNEFGNNSFYINFIKEPKIAFLVVKKGPSVYALTYQKESHPLIQKLLTLLP